MMITSFSGSNFWALVESMAKGGLYKKWFNLNRQWYYILKDLTGEQEEIPTKILLEMYIKKDGAKMGWEMINNLNALQGALYNFFLKEIKPNKENGVKFTSDGVMIDKGFTEVEYLKYVKIFSELITFAKPNECPIIPDTIVEMYSNIKFDEPDWRELSLKDLADNPKDRVPVIFIIDNALYMEGCGDDSFTTLKDTFRKLINDIDESAQLSEAIELFVATCGGGFKQIVDFGAIEHQKAELLTMSSTLPARGRCRMGEAIDGALDRLESRIEQYRDEAIRYYCPWLIILSNGSFVDMESNADAYERLQRVKGSGEIKVYPVGVTEEANLANLKKLDSKEAGIPDSFEGFFKDVFMSLKASQHSQPADNQVNLVHCGGWTSEVKR